jgi:hypothetical protein
LADETAWL